MYSPTFSQSLMLQCLMVGQAPWPLTHTAEPTKITRESLFLKYLCILPRSLLCVSLSATCACGANDAVIDVGAAVDCDLQTVVGVMVLCRLIIGIKLRSEEQRRSDTHCDYWQHIKLLSTHYFYTRLMLLELLMPLIFRAHYIIKLWSRNKMINIIEEWLFCYWGAVLGRNLIYATVHYYHLSY